MLAQSGDQLDIFWKFYSPADTLWSPKTLGEVLGYTTVLSFSSFYSFSTSRSFCPRKEIFDKKHFRNSVQQFIYWTNWKNWKKILVPRWFNSQAFIKTCQMSLKTVFITWKFAQIVENSSKQWYISKHTQSTLKMLTTEAATGGAL